MRQQKPKDDGDWPAIIAAMEAKGLKYFKPGPGRTALRLASFSVAEQEREKAMQEDVEALRSVWENRRRIETIRLAQSRRIKALAPTAEQFERLKTAWFTGGKQALDEEIARIEAEKIGSHHDEKLNRFTT